MLILKCIQVFTIAHKLHKYRCNAKYELFMDPSKKKTDVFKVICKFYFQRPHFIAAASQLEDSPVGFYTLETKKCVCE